MTTTRPDPVERGARLDPDQLAALEEERDFLLRSIDDLEREYEAGDIDETDYRQLSDGYVARTAEVVRAIADQRAAFAGAGRRTSPGRLAAVIVAVLAVGIVAGVVVAQSSGRRREGDTITGAGVVPRTPTQDARDCITLTSGSQIAKAVACYRKVLDRDPKNPTALTYLGWTLVITSGSLTGETSLQAFAAGKAFIAKAVAADPTFPDAWAFSAIVADRSGDPRAAQAALTKLDSLDPSPDIKALTASLRTRVAAELKGATTGSSTTVLTGPAAPTTTTP